MSHHHYCDVTGHEWTCAESSCVCICGEQLNDGDHRECPIELKACPQHVEGLQPGEIAGGVPIDFPEGSEGRFERAVEQLTDFNAVCLWCGHGYAEYNRKAEDKHFALHCPEAPQELKDRATARLTGVDKQ